MALDNYFANLKLHTGVSHIAIVQDRTARPHSMKSDELTCSLMPQLSQSRWMDCSSRSDLSGSECDEPLHLPKRRQSLLPPEEQE